MSDDLELEHWRSVWQTDLTLPSGLRQTAVKQVRRLRMMLMADIGVTIIMGGGCVIWAMNNSPSVRVLAIWIWLTLSAAWIFRWFNNGGNWTGAAPNTHVFLERLRKSYRSTLRNVVFGWILGAFQILFGSIWVFRELNTKTHVSFGDFLTLTPSLVIWACAVSLFGWSAWFSRRLKRELECLEQLQSAWDGLEKHVKESLGTRARRLARYFITLPKLEIQDWDLRRKKRSWRV